MRPDPRNLVLGLALAAGLATPAAATGALLCTGKTVSVRFSFGHLEVLSMLDAVITLDRETLPTVVYATSPQPGSGAMPMTVGQAFADAERMMIDFTDENVNRIVASLRLVGAEEGRDFARAGTLAMPTYGAWPVICEEAG